MEACPRCGRRGEPPAVAIPGLPYLLCHACHSHWALGPTSYFQPPLESEEVEKLEYYASLFRNGGAGRG